MSIHLYKHNEDAYRAVETMLEDKQMPYFFTLKRMLLIHEPSLKPVGDTYLALMSRLP